MSFGKVLLGISVGFVISKRYRAKKLKERALDNCIAAEQAYTGAGRLDANGRIEACMKSRGYVYHEPRHERYGRTNPQNYKIRRQ